MDTHLMYTVLSELKKINRVGINELVNYMEKETDFFTAPCSTKFHLATAGGLMEHSWNVYEVLSEKNKQYNLKYSQDTIRICGLLHDLCKANFYEIAKKWTKDSNGKWMQVDTYVVHDQFPMGHGEKSVSIIQDYIKLTPEEKLAIRWHMAAFDASIHFDYPNGYPYRTASAIPLVVVLFTADYEASQIVENERR